MNTPTNISIKALRSQLQKTAPEGERETIVGTTVRFFSIFLTRILISTPLTPNMVTVLSVLIFLAGISLFIFPEIKIQLIGVGLVYFSIVLDACDGEIARYRKNTGFIGSAFVEPFSHDIQYAILFIPLSIGVYLVTQDITILAVGSIGMISKLLTRFLQVRMDGLMSLYSSGASQSSSPKKRSLAKWMYWVINRNIFSSVGMVIPLLVFTYFGRIDLFIWAYAAGFLGMFVMRFIKEWIRIIKL